MHVRKEDIREIETARYFFDQLPPSDRDQIKLREFRQRNNTEAGRHQTAIAARRAGFAS